MSVDIIREPGVQETVLILLENKKLSTGEVTKLLGKMGVSRWRFNILKPQLINQGLIIEEKAEINKKLLSLTEKGIRVAEGFKMAREAMKE